MDYIFEEDVYEVGAEIDAYCTRCKTDTPHTVITKYEDEIRSVLCTTCNSTHAYRPPRGENEDDIPEPITVKRRQSMHKLPWKAAMQELDVTDPRVYSPREHYVEGEVVDHPRFGLGYISEVLSDTKIEAIFKDDHRILVYNRVDLDLPARSRRSKGKAKEPVAAPVITSTTRKKGKKASKKQSVTMVALSPQTGAIPGKTTGKPIGKIAGLRTKTAGASSKTKAAARIAALRAKAAGTSSRAKAAVKIAALRAKAATGTQTAPDPTVAANPAPKAAKAAPKIAPKAAAKIAAKAAPKAALKIAAKAAPKIAAKAAPKIAAKAAAKPVPKAATKPMSPRAKAAAKLEPPRPGKRKDSGSESASRKKSPSR